LDLSQNVVHVLSCRRRSFRQVWYKSATDCMRNANKCPKIPYSAMVEKNTTVIRNPHMDPDRHQKLITSRGSPLAHACQVWSESISAFVSYPVYRITERTRALRKRKHPTMQKVETKVIQDLNRIFGLIWIRMSVRSVSKCCGCIILSTSVISPSTVQIGH